MKKFFKSRKNVIILCTCISAMLISIFCYCCFWAVDYFDNNIRIKSKEEIIEIFKNNKESFAAVGDGLVDFQYQWAIEKNKSDTDTWKHVKLKNGFYLEVIDSEYFDKTSALEQAIEDEERIITLMKELYVQHISVNPRNDPDCVYFTINSAILTGWGIIYAPNGEPQNPWLDELVEIEPSWYFYIEG